MVLDLSLYCQYISPDIKEITKVEFSKIDQVTIDPGTVERFAVCDQRWLC